MKSTINNTLQSNANPLTAIDCVVESRQLVKKFDQRLVLSNINVQINRGEIVAIVGASGSGKSTLMRALALLESPTSGSIQLFGAETTHLREADLNSYRQRIGVMFQGGALFGDLSVLENVALPLKEHTRLKPSLIDQVAKLKISQVGLKPYAAALQPSQLSGGMRKRVAVARAIALDPEILFLDEPGSGLDPISSDAMDDLILYLNQTLGLTIVMVTHDMFTLRRVADRVVLLADAKVAADCTTDEVFNSTNPIAQQFFHSQRGKAAGARHEH